MNLSENLTLEEVIASGTASRLGIDNSPTEEHLDNLILLAENIFQPIRDYFGESIYIGSGYRSEELNEEIGGAINSDHCKGKAIDIDQESRTEVTNAQIFNFIKDNLEFRQLIYEFGDEYEPQWVHASYDQYDNKGEILIATKVNGRTEYTEY